MPATSASLTRRERQIMDAIYAAGEATVGQVRENMPAPPGYSAVRALIGILEGKGHLRHKVEGNRYVYLPVKARHHAARSMLRNVVCTFFGGSVERAVAMLLTATEAKLSPSEWERLATLIEKGRKEAQGRRR